MYSNCECVTFAEPRAPVTVSRDSALVTPNVLVTGPAVAPDPATGGVDDRVIPAAVPCRTRRRTTDRGRTLVVLCLVAGGTSEIG